MAGAEIAGKMHLSNAHHFRQIVMAHPIAAAVAATVAAAAANLVANI
jgi:hypothetical protein